MLVGVRVPSPALREPMVLGAFRVGPVHDPCPADRSFTVEVRFDRRSVLVGDGGRITGKLSVEADEVRFDGLYDSSNKEIVKGILGAATSLAASGGQMAYLRDTDTEFTIALPRAAIESAAPAKKGLMKRAIVTMKDGSQFTFDYGMLSPKKLIATING